MGTDYNFTNVTSPSGASRGNSVQVQLLLSAPKVLETPRLLFFIKIKVCFGWYSRDSSKAY